MDGFLPASYATRRLSDTCSPIFSPATLLSLCKCPRPQEPTLDYVKDSRRTVLFLHLHSRRSVFISGLEHTVLLQTHWPSRFRYNPKTSGPQ
jgi:hypothetical protein